MSDIDNRGIGPAHLSQGNLYEIKESKTGLKIPVINDVYLHSIYDPYKESELLFNQHIDSLEKRSNVLFLGLGYGYHIQGIIDYYRKNGRDFHIAVIDPNDKVVKDCIKFSQVDISNIDIYCEQSVDDIFRIEKLIDFLLERPVIIPHATSFNLYRNYFTEFLTYRCKNDLSSYIKDIDCKKAREYFNYYKKKDTSLMKVFEDIRAKGEIDDDFEFVIAAFGHMVRE